LNVRNFREKYYALKMSACRGHPLLEPDEPISVRRQAQQAQMCLSFLSSAELHVEPIASVLSYAHVASKFHNHWLRHHYSTLICCIHDNGPELIGHEFKDVLRYYGVKDCPTMISNNPQRAINATVHTVLTKESPGVLASHRDCNLGGIKKCKDLTFQ
jgi:hypothetical protein